MSEVFKYSGVRKSHQSLNEVYFWTSVVKDWKHLLTEDEMEKIITKSYQWLVQHDLVHLWIRDHAQSYSCTLGTIKNEQQRST